ncbi:MAG: SRPBCC family protein [Streptosporangiaceae bacterium]
MSSRPTQIDAPTGTPFLDVCREFDAPPDLVFRAATDPDLVPQWLGPREMLTHIIQFDARTGGSYRYANIGTAGEEYIFRGVFHTVTPSAVMIQTFEFEDEPGNVSLEARTFEDVGDGRTLMRQHTVFPTVAARDQALASGMRDGITDSMDRLGELLERSPQWQR